MAVATMTVTAVPMPASMLVPVIVLMPVLMPVPMSVLVVLRRVLSAVSVRVIALMIVRVWHEVGKPLSGVYT